MAHTTYVVGLDGEPLPPPPPPKPEPFRPAEGWFAFLLVGIATTTPLVVAVVAAVRGYPAVEALWFGVLFAFGGWFYARLFLALVGIGADASQALSNLADRDR